MKAGTKVLCSIMAASLIFSGCASVATRETAAESVEALQIQEIKSDLNAGAGILDALEQLVANGEMSDGEMQSLAQFLQEQAGNGDSVRMAIEQGLLTRQQADALKQRIEAPGQVEDAPAGGETITASTIQSVIKANQIEEQLLADVGYSAESGGYPIVDTGQTVAYSDSKKISIPKPGQDFYGQDANYAGNTPSYTDNGDGTVTDNVTGLMWQQDPGEKMTWEEAVANLEDFNLAGYDDWRLPTIKELYSLINFSGSTKQTAKDSVPYIDDNYFIFTYGDATGERVIDSQYATSTIYESDTMGGKATMFGVNFADGRIKGYPIEKTFYVMYVRGNTHYGVNDFLDNGDGTITDTATGLMWMKYDSGYFNSVAAGDGGLDWEQALNWAEDLDYAGYDDWTLPDAKQLQSIVDYSRSPDTTASAAVSSVFQATKITNIMGESDYASYWTGTTHQDGRPVGGYAVYVSFGEALGQMNGAVMDVHGAGAQRSDPKTGSADDYPFVHSDAPQGDVQSVFNLVRAVRIAE